MSSFRTLVIPNWTGTRRVQVSNANERSLCEETRKGYKGISSLASQSSLVKRKTNKTKHPIPGTSNRTLPLWPLRKGGSHRHVASRNVDCNPEERVSGFETL